VGSVAVKLLRFAPVLALLALAAFLTLLAADVRSWHAALATGDATFAVTPREADWSPSTHLPSGLSSALLGVGDDVADRRALQLFRGSLGVQAQLDNVVQVTTGQAGTEAALERAASSGDAVWDSQAQTLLGVLVLGNVSQGGTANQADQAVSDFQSAVRLDPDNDSAKFDLELLFRVLAPHGVRLGSQPGTGVGPGHHGAGGGIPGQGY
jgi:hypothetical protein